jgi:hypothetical protein
LHDGLLFLEWLFEPDGEWKSAKAFSKTSVALFNPAMRG